MAQSGSGGPIFLLIHGAGHSALSFALLAKQMKNYATCTVFAFDMRGHGNICFLKRALMF